MPLLAAIFNLISMGVEVEASIIDDINGLTEIQKSILKNRDNYVDVKYKNEVIDLIKMIEIYPVLVFPITHYPRLGIESEIYEEYNNKFTKNDCRVTGLELLEKDLKLNKKILFFRDDYYTKPFREMNCNYYFPWVILYPTIIKNNYYDIWKYCSSTYASKNIIFTLNSNEDDIKAAREI